MKVYKCMAVIRGLDNGYSYTKDNELWKIKSLVCTDDTMKCNSPYILINGKKTYPGVGQSTVDIDKCSSEVTMACTIANLIKTGAEEIFLSVGLPIGFYKEQKQRFKDTIYGYEKLSIVYQDIEYKFKFNAVDVYPQGVGALYSLNVLRGDYLVLDIGGLTVDIALVETIDDKFTISKTDSLTKGIKTLLPDITNEINMKFGLREDINRTEKFLIDGSIYYKGEQKSLTFLNPLLQDYVDEILESIKAKYPLESCPIYLCGGGARLLYNQFTKRVGNVNVLNDSQFANAIGYYNLGKSKYVKYLKGTNNNVTNLNVGRLSYQQKNGY